MPEASDVEQHDRIVDPRGRSWTVSIPTSRLQPRTVASPLSDHRFRAWLADLREWSCRPVRRGHPQARGTEEYLHYLAGMGSDHPTTLRWKAARQRIGGDQTGYPREGGG